jgi:nucleotide-binding universal stress UspA family protein
LLWVQEVLRSGHDLLMRSHARDLAAQPRGFGAIDMQLFRQCPCPVWAVGPGATGAPRRILAAVHANPDDEDEQRLNGKIIDLALSLAALQNASVVLFQAWTAFGEELLRSRHSPTDLDAYVEAAETAATSALESLASSLGDRAAQVRLELRKGHPEEVIPEYVVSEGIDLVVMGTVARTGISGLVIGNTAERLLQRLVSSVIAVKPDGFVSSIRAGDA